MDNDFIRAIQGLSARNVLKRMAGVRMLHRRAMSGCPLSRLALEYVFEHDPNSAVKNRVLLVMKRSSLEPRSGYWEKHFSF